MKIHELAKEYNQKAHEFLKQLTDLGFVYSSHTKDLSEIEVDNIKSMIAKAAKAKDPEQIKIREYSLVTMIGIHYNLQDGRYYIATYRAYPEEFDKVGILLSKPYPSINHLTHDLNQLTVDAGFFNPSELQKIRAKSLTDSKK